MQNICAVILAAGDGTRMRSARPKVLSEVLFRPMITWVCDACEKAGIHDCIAVLGAGGDDVRAVLPSHFRTVEQSRRLGTAHAVMMAREYILQGGFSDVAVLCGDAPFVRAEDLKNAYNEHKRLQNAVTVLSARVPDPTGYGRIIRGMRGVRSIVEHADATEDDRLVDEINAGVYWFDAGFLLGCFDRITADNVKGEYYITDAVSIAVSDGLGVDAWQAHPDAVLGANDRKSLARLNEIARRRVVDEHLSNGVDIPFMEQVVIGAQAKIGADTRILPGTIIKGATIIGEGCEIGPNSVLDTAVIGSGSKVISSHITRSTVGTGTTIGPMSYLRPDCEVGDNVKIGDFVELKNSSVGDGTSISHLTYVGDSDVGKRCNFGCGVVTVNYDGRAKYRTRVCDDAFIGCNVNLVAPVTLGEGSYCAAGTTVTEDVPAQALAIGRARQTVKEGWNREGGRYKRKR